MATLLRFCRLKPLIGLNISNINGNVRTKTLNINRLTAVDLSVKSVSNGQLTVEGISEQTLNNN